MRRCTVQVCDDGLDSLLLIKYLHNTKMLRPLPYKRPGRQVPTVAATYYIYHLDHTVRSVVVLDLEKLRLIKSSKNRERELTGFRKDIP